KALYVSSGALYLHFSGMSDGSAATAYMAAIPSQPMEFDYVAEGFAKRDALREAGLLARTQLLRDQGLYVVVTPLQVKNGGTFTAVFPADELTTVTGRVIRGILPIGITVMLISLGISLVMGALLTRPIHRMVEQISRMERD